MSLWGSSELEDVVVEIIISAACSATYRWQDPCVHKTFEPAVT